MADQISTLKITAIDQTARALTAADNARKLSNDASKVFTPATKGADEYSKAVQHAAKHAG
jgi:hypothetical protein